MDRQIPTFQAKCGHCGGSFEHPSLGDFAYGEALFSTADGQRYAWVDAFADFPQRLSDLLQAADPGRFWAALASLADPIDGQPLQTGLRCPHCASSEIETWEGERLGLVAVPAATFAAVSGLETAALLLRLPPIFVNS